MPQLYKADPLVHLWTDYANKVSYFWIKYRYDMDKKVEILRVSDQINDENEKAEKFGPSDSI